FPLCRVFRPSRSFQPPALAFSVPRHLRAKGTARGRGARCQTCSSLPLPLFPWERPLPKVRNCSELLVKSACAKRRATISRENFPDQQPKYAGVVHVCRFVFSIGHICGRRTFVRTGRRSHFAAAALSCGPADGRIRWSLFKGVPPMIEIF